MAGKLKVLWQRAEAKRLHRCVSDHPGGRAAGVRPLAAHARSTARRLTRRSCFKALTYFQDGDLPALHSDVRNLLIEAAANVREIPEVRRAAERLSD
jgi:hypothetical protein